MWSVLRWVAKALGALVLLVLLAEATIEIESEGGDIRLVGIRVIWIVLRLVWWLANWVWHWVT